MRALITILFLLIVTQNIMADILLDCEDDSVRYATFSNEDSCRAQDEAFSSEELGILYQKTIDDFNKAIAKESKAPPFGVSAKQGFLKLKKSQVLWEELVAINCSLLIENLQNAGGQMIGPAITSCKNEENSKRIAFIKEIRSYWLLDELEAP